MSVWDQDREGPGFRMETDLLHYKKEQTRGQTDQQVEHVCCAG